MWLYLLISLGACEALFVLGLFVYWIIINIKKTSRANRSNPTKAEGQNPSTITETIAGLSLEQHLDEVDHAPDFPKETNNKTGDDDWLNAGIPEVSASTIKQQKDDWLNASLPAVPSDVYKQQDDDWLNAVNNQPVEIDGSSSPYQSLQDIINVKPVEEAVNKTHGLMDDITVKPVEEAVAESHALMDDITVKPVEEAVTERHALMDDITVKPVEKANAENHLLTDEISLRPVENQNTETHVLLDEILIKPFPGPVRIEYEILDDLITKSAIYRAKKAKPTSDVVITNPVENPIEKVEPPGDAIIVNPVESPVEKIEPSGDVVMINPVKNPVENPEPIKTVSVNEITEFLKERRDLIQATIPPMSTEPQSTPFLGGMSEGMGKLLSQVKNLYRKAALPGAATKALATLRILNNNEFYIQDTNLTQMDTSIQEPQIKGFTFKVLTTANELDELIDGGYELVMNFGRIKRGLKKGMIAFLGLVDRELASVGSACITEESKVTLREYPYDGDLDSQVCIVGDWTNPKFRDSGISNYIKRKRQQLLKEKGFTFERSIVDENIAIDVRSTRAQEKFELTYKRRTYINVSLPGILGVELRKERSLNEADTKPLYQMITLLVLALPSPPMVAD